MKDLACLEEDGLYIPSLGIYVKGTVFCVGTDNLGAHFLGGFVESFSSAYVCRFCLGEWSQIQVSDVRSGEFSQKLKIKQYSTLTENLKHFDVLSGYPLDLLHDLFEGIVPLELALYLSTLIKGKCFTLDELNKSIKQFPYAWADKTDAPQPVPLNFATKKQLEGMRMKTGLCFAFSPL